MTFGGLALPAHADVTLRVEARPLSDPIQAFVTVLDDAGNPQGGLAAANFAITIDGQPVAIQADDLTLPPSQNPDQRVSVVLAMDYSRSVTDVAQDVMEQSAIDFIGSMNNGDYAAVMKFNVTTGALIIHPLIEIDHGANSANLVAAVGSTHRDNGEGTNLLDALVVSLDHILASAGSLPAGPKAIILISDGGENESTAQENDVIAQANDNSVSIFTIGVGDITLPERAELMGGLADETGGAFFPGTSEQEIAEAYAAVSVLLNNEYVISIPSDIDDCELHRLSVKVTGHPRVASDFARRLCDTTPDQFSFPTQNAVPRNETMLSEPATIMGLEVPAHISVIQGRYSIGCTDSFTGEPGTIANGETVCVRHESSTEFSTAKTTTLTIGGVAGTFTSVTADDPGDGGGGGGGGGGGATGLFELLLGLAALLLVRRRLA
jgi:VWFA-related protein